MFSLTFQPQTYNANLFSHRLQCIDCGRSNFGSAQGFINHCRLAHGRDFATHDLAADECGIAFDTTGVDPSLLPPMRTARGSKAPAVKLQPATTRKKAPQTYKNTAKASGAKNTKNSIKA